MGKQGKEQKRRRKEAERRLFGANSLPDPNRVRASLSEAALEEINFPDEVVGYLRHLAVEYQKLLREEDYTALSHSCLVMTAKGRGSRKSIIEYQLESWGNSQKERHRIIYEAGGKFAGVEGLPIAVYFRYEAWGTDDPNHKGQTPLSDYLDKFEEINFTGTTADGRTARAAFRFTRGPDDRIIPAEQIEVRSTESLTDDVISVYDTLAELFFSGWVSRMSKAQAAHLSRN